MAEGLIERHIHAFKKRNFGNINPVKIAEHPRTASVTFSGSGTNSIFVVSGNKDPGDTWSYGSINSVSVSGSGKILYSSKDDSSIGGRGSCAVVTLTTQNDSCTVTFTNPTSCIVARIDVKNAHIDVVDRKSAQNIEQGTHSLSIKRTNEQNGALFIGVANMGKHDGVKSFIDNRSSCGGSSVSYQIGNDEAIIGTYVPSSNSNSFEIGTKNADKTAGYAEVHAVWLFSVYSTY